MDLALSTRSASLSAGAGDGERDGGGAGEDRLLVGIGGGEVKRIVEDIVWIAAFSNLRYLQREGRHFPVSRFWLI